MTSQIPAPIDLAREPDFTLGAAAIYPASAEVVTADARIRLQPRVMQVLIALARAGGRAVSRDELSALCWGGIVVGDDALNRCVARLRRLSEEIPASFSLETLPRVGYRLTAFPSPPVATAAPPAGPGAAPGMDEGPPVPGPPAAPPEPREGSAARPPEPPGQPRRAGGETRRPAAPRRLAALASATVAGLAAIALWIWLHPRAPPVEGVAIAPFAVEGGSPGLGAQAGEAAGQVAHALAVAGVKVLRTAAGSSPEAPIYEIEGKLARADADVELTTELVGRDRLVHWSGRFVRPLAEGRLVGAQAGAKLADLLACALNTASNGGPLDTTAADAFLKACDVLRDVNVRDTIPPLLQTVVKRAPRFGRAWAMLAEGEAIAARRMPPEEARAARESARSAARTALRLDPTSGLAYDALALSSGELGWLDTDSLLAKGLKVDPYEPNLLADESDLMFRTGRTAEGLGLLRRAADLDPLSPHKHLRIVNALAANGRIGESLAALDRYRGTWPEDEGWRLTRLEIDARYGDPRAALAALAGPDAASLTDARREALRRLALARQAGPGPGRDAYVREELAEFQAGRLARSEAVLDLTNVDAVDAAYGIALSTPALPAGRGAKDLDPEILWRSFADGFRRDRRFMALAARLGLTEYWTTTGRWPDICSVPNWPWDCRAAARAVTRPAAGSAG